MNQLINFSRKMKNVMIVALLLISVGVKAQNAEAIQRAIKYNGNIPGWYILNNSIPVTKIMGVPMADSLGSLSIGTYTYPKEKLNVGGSIKISSPQAYSTVTANATTPVPAGGGGTIIYLNNHFYGWIGTAWKQLDN